MKNITYRGFSTFIRALRKHVLAGTYANFWTEVHSRKHALVHSKFTLAGQSQTIVYMNQLVDRMIELMPDISDQEMLDVINQVLRISFMFEQKYFFMISVNEVEQEAPVIADPVAQRDTIEADKATLVPSTKDNGLQQATDTLELIKDVEIDLNAELPEEEDPRVEADIDAARQQELKALTVPQLRDILKKREIKYHPAAKEAKLIELILSSD